MNDIQNRPDISRASEREMPTAKRRDIYDRIDGAVRMRREWDRAHGRTPGKPHPLVEQFPVNPPPQSNSSVDDIDIGPIIWAASAVVCFCGAIWACVWLQSVGWL